MSLIVARKHKNNLLIFSDTKLTYKFKDKNSPKDGTIKAIILTSKIAICYAGDVHFAELALKEIRGRYSNEEIKAILLKYHHESNQLTDFILAISEDEPYFLVFKDGCVVEEDSCWIGSKDGFSKFQEYFLSNYEYQDTWGVSFDLVKLPDTDDLEFRGLYYKLFNAMVGVIECNEIQEVGGFIVPLLFENDHFCYQYYVNVFRKALDVEDEMDGDGPTTIGFSNAEDGAFAVNFSGGITAELAIHFFQGNIGVVYQRDNHSLLNPKLLPAMDEIDFSEYLKAKTSVSLAFSMAHGFENFAIKGEKAFRENDFDLAIKRFEQAIIQSSKTWGPDPSKDSEYKSLNDFIKDKGHAEVPSEHESNLEIIFIMLGDSYNEKCNFLQAKKSYKDALILNSSSLETKYRLGLVCANNNEMDEALRIFTDCIDEHEHIDSYYSRGAVYFHQKDYDEAKVNFHQALKLDDTHELSKIALCEVSRIEGLMQNQ